MKIPVLVIFAPTATGKTDLLFRLFARGAGIALPAKAKIISADSMQVYRGLDICSAKPTVSEQEILPHYLIDIKNPDEQFSAAEFVERADALCDEFLSQGCVPVVCGGTGFYIRAFLLGLPQTPEGDEYVRFKLKEEHAALGNEVMWERLYSVDPQSAQKINLADTYRILRALEIYELTGKPRAEFAQSAALRQKYDFKTIILERDREDLYRRIEERVDKMFVAGLEGEVRALMKKYGKDAPAMKAIGCQEFFESDSLEEIKAKIKHNSKRYAKKQYVFMRGIPGARIFHIPAGQDYTQEVLDFFQKSVNI